MGRRSTAPAGRPQVTAPGPQGRDALLLLALAALLCLGAWGSGTAARGASGHPPGPLSAISAQCSPPECFAVSFNLSSPGAGTLFLSAESGHPITQNTVVDVAPGTYVLDADPAQGYSFQGWTTTGEIQVSNPNSPQTNVTVQTSNSGVEALFSSGSSPSILAQPWVWAVLGAGVTLAVVGGAVWLLRRRGPAPPAPGAPPPAATPAAAASTWSPSEATDLGRWEKNALTALEGVSESELWPAVHQSGFPAERLLCFTYGRADRLAPRYELTGATVVRVSRLEPRPGVLQVAPTDLEGILDLIEKHLTGGEGRGVVIPSVETLILAGGIRNVVRMVEVSRDHALDRKGSVLFTVNPAAISPSDLALLERGAKKP